MQVYNFPCLLKMDSDDTINISPVEQYISHVLPNLTERESHTILEKLLEIGVESPSDFQFVTEEDLVDLQLRPVQTRKLLTGFKTYNQGINVL